MKNNISQLLCNQWLFLTWHVISLMRRKLGQIYKHPSHNFIKEKGNVLLNNSLLLTNWLHLQQHKLIFMAILYFDYPVLVLWSKAAVNLEHTWSGQFSHISFFPSSWVRIEQKSTARRICIPLISGTHQPLSAGIMWNSHQTSLFYVVAHWPQNQVCMNLA